jgi:hypothetical protein
MVEEFAEWERPSWLPAVDWTPAQEWGRITGRQDPFWEARRPMEQLGERLQARYLLGAPEMARAGQQWDVGPGFEDYVGGFMGAAPSGFEAVPGFEDYRARTYQDLLSRATLAAEATRQPMGEYMSGFTPQTDPWRTAAWYGGMFNPMAAGQQSAAANQLAVATLLAQQRQGSGTPYTGAMGRSIASALAQQQRYRQDIGKPAGTFLDWYLSQLNGAGGIGEGDS